MSKHKIWISALILQILPINLLAHKADEQNSLNLNRIEITKESEPENTEKSGLYTTKQMNTATGLELSIRQTPQSVSVISNRLMKDLNLHDAKDALGYATGIHTTSELGAYRFMSRGFEIDNIQEDALASPAASSAQGSLNTAKELSELIFYDRVEILRGVAGLTQSNANPGGTINLIRKKPTKDFQAILGLSAGSYSRYKGSFDVSGALNSSKSVSARIIGSLSASNSFKDIVSEDRGAIGAAVGFDIGDSSVFNTGVIYQKTSETPDIYGVPAIDKNGDRLNLSPKSYFGAKWSRRVFEKINSFSEFTHYINDDLSVSAKLNYTTSKGKLKFGQFWNNFGVRRQKYDTTSDEINLKLETMGKFELFGNEHDMFLNSQISRDKFTGDDRWAELRPLTGFDIKNFNHDAIAEPNWNSPALHLKHYLKMDQRSFSGGVRLNLTDSLHLLTGGRFSEVRYANESYNLLLNTKSPEEKLSNSKFTPYAGLTFDVAKNHSLYVSYAEIFKPQMSKNAKNEFLKPVKGSNYEAGLKSEFFEGNLNSAISFFQTIQENKAIPDPNLYPSKFWVSEGKVRSRGVDVEISGKASKNWQIFAGYTLNKSIYLQDEKTNPTLAPHSKGENATTYIPRHIFRFYSSYNPPMFKSLSVGAGMRYQSKTGSYYKTGFGAAPEQKAYALFDANINYKINKNFDVNFSIKNITNKKYFLNSMIRSANMHNYYGEPRNLMLTVNYAY